MPTLNGRLIWITVMMSLLMSNMDTDTIKKLHVSINWSSSVSSKFTENHTSRVGIKIIRGGMYHEM